MISLEQIRQLDIRVRKAIAAIRNLTQENARLEQQLSRANEHVGKLESELEALKERAHDLEDGEHRIEIGLQGVLDALDEIEDSTGHIIPPDIEQSLSEGNMNDSLDDEQGKQAIAPDSASIPETDNKNSSDKKKRKSGTRIQEGSQGSAANPSGQSRSPEQTVAESGSGKANASPNVAEPVAETADDPVDEVNLDASSDLGDEPEKEFQSEFDIF